MAIINRDLTILDITCNEYYTICLSQALKKEYISIIKKLNISNNVIYCNKCVEHSFDQIFIMNKHNLISFINIIFNDYCYTSHAAFINICNVFYNVETSSMETTFNSENIIDTLNGFYEVPGYTDPGEMLSNFLSKHSFVTLETFDPEKLPDLLDKHKGFKII